MVRSIKLVDLAQVTAFTKYVGNIKIELLKPQDNILGPALTVKKIPITLTTTQTNATTVSITDCFLIGDTIQNHGFKIIRNSQSWTVPAGVTTVLVELWGAGGGGGGSCLDPGGGGNDVLGGHGGGGEYIKTSIAVTPNTSIAATVGNGGAHGSCYLLAIGSSCGGVNPGGAGGNTTFAGLTAHGGSGGGGSCSAGTGGSGGGGEFNVVGTDGNCSTAGMAFGGSGGGMFGNGGINNWYFGFTQNTGAACQDGSPNGGKGQNGAIVLTW